MLRMGWKVIVPQQGLEGEKSTRTIPELFVESTSRPVYVDYIKSTELLTTLTTCVIRMQPLFDDMAWLNATIPLLYSSMRRLQLVSGISGRAFGPKRHRSFHCSRSFQPAFWCLSWDIWLELCPLEWWKHRQSLARLPWLSAASCWIFWLHAYCGVSMQQFIRLGSLHTDSTKKTKLNQWFVGKLFLHRPFQPRLQPETIGWNLHSRCECRVLNSWTSMIPHALLQFMQMSIPIGALTCG